MLIPQRPYQVREIEVNGRRPFGEWMRKLKDGSAKAAILARIARIEVSGNFGDYRYIGDGVFEIKISLGPSYRIYFGLSQAAVVLLLLGGDKSKQVMDIQKAKHLWKQCQFVKKGR